MWVTQINYAKLCELIASNNVITAICNITSLIGFGMTIYVSLKTKSIDKRIQEFKSTKDFNRKRTQHINSLKTYQTSLIEDNVDIYKIRTNMLNDINVIYESYRYIFKFSQKVIIYRVRKQLEKRKK